MWSVRSLLVAFVPLVVVACGNTPDAGAPHDAAPPEGGPIADAGASSDANLDFPAFHPAYPQIISTGGPILTSPNLVAFVFPEHQFYADVVAFTNSFVDQRDFWQTVGAEYGVGPITSARIITMPNRAPPAVGDSQLQQYLTDHFDGDDPIVGQPDSNAIYTFFYPAQTTVLYGDGTTALRSCYDFNGYHSSFTYRRDEEAGPGQDIAYAVIPLCPGLQNFTPLDLTTAAASHEWIEAATDPYPSDVPGFSTVDEDHAAFALALGAREVADMCEMYQSSFFKPDGYAYTLQRVWSNKAAREGHDPCVPAVAGQVYFDSVPLFDESFPLSPFGHPLVTKGAIVPLGTSKTYEIDLSSDGETFGPWDLSVEELSAFGGVSGTLGFSWDRFSGANGEKLHLTITARNRSNFGVSSFIIISTLGPRAPLWAGLVWIQ